jgi:hypothetical protein
LSVVDDFFAQLLPSSADKKDAENTAAQKDLPDFTDFSAFSE